MAFYKRSTFLINPTFQLSFSLIVCSIIFISSLLYPVIILDFFSEITQRFPEIRLNLKLAQSDLILYLVMMQLIFIVMVFIMFIFLTHKIAGPMHKLKMHLQNIRAGEAIGPLSFRDGDHFHDVAEEVSLFLEHVASKQEKDFQYLDEISQYLQNLEPILPDDKKPILKEISRRLEEINNRYNNPS